MVDLPVPPQRMALVRGGRPLKRWTYVGAFGPELMLCAARARIAGLSPGGRYGIGVAVGSWRAAAASPSRRAA